MILGRKFCLRDSLGLPDSLGWKNFAFESKILPKFEQKGILGSKNGLYVNNEYTWMSWIFDDLISCNFVELSENI